MNLKQFCKICPEFHKYDVHLFKGGREYSIRDFKQNPDLVSYVIKDISISTKFCSDKIRINITL